MISIDISKLKRSPGEVKELTMAADLPPLVSGTEQIVFDGPLQLQLKLANIKEAISVEGSVRANLKLACGSCLEFFAYPVEAEFSEVYYNEAQAEIIPGEEWIPYSGDHLNLTPEVLKSLLVVLPMRLVCSADCKGLCPVCGKNKNSEECDCIVKDIDPRLAALKKLLEKNE